jgi:hypothetical protein
MPRNTSVWTMQDSTSADTNTRKYTNKDTYFDIIVASRDYL